MWEQLRPSDIDRAKRRLALERAAMLSRHAAELKELDSQQDQIEKFDQLVAAFAEKYLKAEMSMPEAIIPFEEQPTENAIAAEAGESRDEPSPVLQIEQRVSPNFGIPLRRFVGR